MKLLSIYLFIYFLLGIHSGHLLPSGLSSSHGKGGLLSSCSEWASHCNGFSCCRAQALGDAGFQYLENRFSRCDTLA